MAIRQCYYCMKELDPYSEYCPQCGHVNSYVAREQASYALPCGTMLHDRYLMGRVLGKGGFGITYIGFDLVLQARVCIKEYYPVGAAYRDASRSMRVFWNPESPAELTVSGREHFTNEARKAVKLRSFQSVVKVWDVFSENDTSYIIMDFIEGVTLKEFIRQRGQALEPAEMVRLFTPVLNDLNAIHQLGIIHRDISPDNLMIKTNGELTLLDLGAAKDLRNDTTDATMHVARRGYSPPEQYLFYTQIKPSTDVYAMCATIYYCLCGKAPTNPLERSSGVTLDFSAVPPKLASVLARGLDPQPEKRYQSMQELRDALVESVPKQKSNKGFGAFLRNNKVLIAVASVVLFSLIGIFALLLPPPTKGSATAAVSAPKSNAISVTALGTTNANLNNNGGYAVIDEEYCYYISADDAAYACAYSIANQGYNYSDARKVAEQASFLSTDGQHLYFISLRNYETSAICRTDRAGGNLVVLRQCESGSSYRMLQFVELSDGSRYLYYLQSAQSDAQRCSLRRYDLDTDYETVLIDDHVAWYNLYGDSLYYTVASSNYANVSLYRSTVDGEHAVVLNDNQDFISGFAQDGMLCLFSNQTELLHICDFEGNTIKTLTGLAIDHDRGVGYESGWIYYTNKTDGSVHRARADASLGGESDRFGDEVVLSGHAPLKICCCNYTLWLSESTPSDTAHRISRSVSFASKKGDTLTLVQSCDAWDLPYAKASEFTYRNDTGGILITGYQGKMTSFQIPGQIDGKKVVGIGSKAFHNTGIEAVAMPSGVASVGVRAFYECAKLQFVGLPEGLTKIGEWAFGNCTALKSVDLPRSLETLDMLAFAQSGLKSVTIPANVKSIGDGCFAIKQNVGFTGVTVDTNNTSFTSDGGILFSKDLELICFPSGRSDASYSIPGSIKTINSYSFAFASSLQEVTIPNSVKTIESNAFFSTNIKEIVVSANCSVADDLGSNITVRTR